MPWEQIFQAFFIAPCIYGIYLESKRRSDVARGMAKDWLQRSYSGCYIQSIQSSTWRWPVVVVLRVYTSKDEDFDIKLRVRSVLQGIYKDEIEIVYIRKEKV